jgi:PAS domain S-box-containing protein
MSLPVTPIDKHYPNSKDRLAELQSTGLLDTPAEEVFDRFTVLASKILGTPVVLLSLLDENRQFFKSQTGLREPWATRRQIPLTHSFCQFVVDNQVPLIISDARLNEKLAKHPAIEELGMIAYAGIPLLTPQGHAIGSFCAIDSQPHQWTEYEVEVLTGLAQAIMAEIALLLSAHELRSAKNRAESIVKSIADAFFQLDEDCKFTYINDPALQLLKHSSSELRGQNIWQEFPVLSDNAFERQCRKVMEHGEPVTFEHFYGPLDAWLEFHVYPCDEGLSVYFHDITSTKQDQERLRLLESVVVRANDTVIITEAYPMSEPGPRILYVNAAFCQLTGYTSEEVLGRSPRFLQGAETERDQLDLLHDALEAKQSMAIEVLNYRKNGTTYWAEMSLAPVVDMQGHTTHWISIQRDVTERRRSQQVLQDAKREAERANLAKSEFLSRMSHELRTPLNAILGFGQLLKDSDLVPDDVESAEHIVVAGRHLLGLINEVLDIAQIESGRTSLHLEQVSVSGICQEAVALLRGKIAESGLTLIDESQVSSAYVAADRKHLKQILVNLLSNATKYNRAGASIRVMCEAREEGRLRICVLDEGMGIAPEDFERLFTPFERLGAQASGIEGLGIGLALSRRLADQMGGTLGVDSAVGVGSSFWIELPLAREPEYQSANEFDGLSREEREGLTIPDRRRVLYVEDNLSNLQLVQRVLSRRDDIELISAMHARDGLKLAQQKLPDLILLDLHLPEVNGEEVLRLLQSDERTRPIPVIIVSADIIAGQVDRMLQMGATAYLAKPFSVREFYKILDAAFANAPSAAAPDPSAPSANGVSTSESGSNIDVIKPLNLS